MDEVTTGLYSVAQVRELEARAVAGGVAGYTLMQRAAARCWREIQDRWPAGRIHVVCGSGNNGGDGYEIARLARAAGREVCLMQIGAPPQAGDGGLARQAWRDGGGTEQDFAAASLEGAALIVDALFGIGLTRDVTGLALEVIQAINRSAAPVLAVDLPSGLDADSGAVKGAAVAADVSVSFIGRKLGMLTGAAADHVGELVFDPLGLPPDLSSGMAPVARLLTAADLPRALPPRARTAHKGSHGHVLIVGGDFGMAGAVLLAGRAALRSGAGLVSIATRVTQAAALSAAQPELMCRGAETPGELRAMLQRVDAVAIGPGLGQDVWGSMMLSTVLETKLPLVLDADALNLLAQNPATRADWVLTPHPGEAARLLSLGTAQIQAGRPAAASALQKKYGGVCVLKGAGTLVQGAGLAVCADGNPGMGVGGMGDVLTGVIVALIGQGLPPELAAQTGVLVHARAGDAAARAGERGLLPSDLIEALRAQVNPP